MGGALVGIGCRSKEIVSPGPDVPASRKLNAGILAQPHKNGSNDNSNNPSKSRFECIFHDMFLRCGLFTCRERRRIPVRADRKPIPVSFDAGRRPILIVFAAAARLGVPFNFGPVFTVRGGVEYRCDLAEHLPRPPAVYRHANSKVKVQIRGHGRQTATLGRTRTVSCIPATHNYAVTTTLMLRGAERKPPSNTWSEKKIFCPTTGAPNLAVYAVRRFAGLAAAAADT